MNQSPYPPANGRPEKKSFFHRFALLLKLLLIGFLLLILLIPLSMVESLIQQRESAADAARTEIAGKWSLAQQIVGPVLSVPCLSATETADAQGVKTVRYTRRYINILPESLKIDGRVNTQTLSRGIYEAVMYRSSLQLSGEFRLSEEEAARLTEYQADFSKARLSVGITDLRGLETLAVLRWDDQKTGFSPGTGDDTGLSSVLSTGVDATSLSENGSSIAFSTDLSLKGSESLYFIPVGKTTSVHLSSDCATPSFSGNFLPSQREVSPEGFQSVWNVIGMNRNYPQILENIGRNEAVQQSAFGVELLVPVAQYQMAVRAVKYAVLIILLTFVVVLFAEIVLRRRLGPLPYLLTGLALVLFYSLLVALSEHIGFALSYLTASAMTTGLLLFYMRSVLGQGNAAWGVAGMLMLLYAYIYILMQMETYALLAGSLGLFAILAGVMFLSQKVGIDKLKE